MSWRRIAAAAAVLATAGLAAAPAAEASFHLIKVREVFPGTAAHPDSDYVELQMYAAGENLVQLGNLKVFDSAGVLQSTLTPTKQVASGANQSMVLIADTDYAGQFPGGPAPDFSSDDLNLVGSGGAVCWPQTEPPFDDCASWGNFTGQAMLPSMDTAPAPAIPDGIAIRRSIAPGCSTLLESGDDTDNSSADFALVPPAPRDNASPVTEAPCSGGAPPHQPPGGGGKGNGAPQTIIGKAPPKRTHDRTPSFRFRSSEAGSTFQCRIDRKPFRACRSPYTAKALAPGHHRFSVRASHGGQTDATPASFSFTVLR
jgi:hypothetical protein